MWPVFEKGGIIFWNFYLDLQGISLLSIFSDELKALI